MALMDAGDKYALANTHTYNIEYSTNNDKRENSSFLNNLFCCWRED